MLSARKEFLSMLNDDGIFLHNTPLPESETLVTMNLYSEEQGIRIRGRTLLKEKGLEGRITFDPERCLIFSIPPVRSALSMTPIIPDRNLWDLYLIIIPFTLHEAPDDS